MTDKLSPARRSANMSRIRSKDSTPEMLVRRLVFKLGYRYRLHRANLPGKPDLVFPSRKKAVFVHGCFWHQHQGCREGRTPGSNETYWGPKLQRNVDRDRQHEAELRRLGWQVLVVWECQLRDSGTLAQEVGRFLGRV